MTYTGLDRAIALAAEKFIGIYDKSGELSKFNYIK